MNTILVSEESFGSRKPGLFWQSLVNICHQSQAPLRSRLFAPLVRKAMLKRPSMLPVDLTLSEFNLRCQFTDNYSEKKFVFTPWRFDKYERELLSEKLSNGGTFLDIGANVGLYTLTALKALQGNVGRIIAIEPNPPTLARFKANLAANTQLHQDKIQIDILEVGIADRDTDFELSVDQGNLGASSIATQNRSTATEASKTKVTIHCRPLLDVLAELDVQGIDALKIDIEGAEDLALMPYLESAPDSLLAKTIFIENSAHLWSQDLFATMANRGYQRIFHSKMNSIFSLPES